MYLLSRLMLLASVVLAAYGAGVALVLGVPEFFPEHQGLVWCALAGLTLVALRKRGRRLFSSGGTAAWATPADLERGGLIGGRTGLILGRVAPDGAPLGSAVRALVNPRLGSAEACREFFHNLRVLRRKKGRVVRLPKSAVHSMIVAPVGAGKSTGLVIPFLMTCAESCVVVDFKGELATITADRRRRMGKVVILDPYGLVTKSRKLKRDAARFNPLDFIAADERAFDECNDLAKALVVRGGEEKDPHWNDKAEEIIAGIAATTVFYGQKDKGRRSLQDVREIVAHPQKFATAQELMLQQGGMLARWGAQLGHIRGEEWGSVMSTTTRHLRFLDTPAVAHNTQASSFDPVQLRQGRMTVYLVLPPEHARAQSGLLRLWIGSLFRACLRGGLGERRKVHFVLDEAAALGVDGGARRRHRQVPRLRRKAAILLPVVGAAPKLFPARPGPDAAQ